MKPALRKKRPAVALRWGLEHTFKTGANKLQPFYLQTGSGRTVLNRIIAKMKNWRISLFFILILYFGCLGQVIWGL